MASFHFWLWRIPLISVYFVCLVMDDYCISVVAILDYLPFPGCVTNQGMLGLLILDCATIKAIRLIPTMKNTYIISYEICTISCFCIFIFVFDGFIWFLYPYLSGLIQWYWGNYDGPSATEIILENMGITDCYQTTLWHIKVQTHLRFPCRKMWMEFWANLTHWGREMHTCVGKLTIIASDNGLSPGQRQTIIWTNAGILLIGPLGTNFNEIIIEFIHFHSRKCTWKCCLENGVHFVSASMC